MDKKPKSGHRKVSLLNKKGRPIPAHSGVNCQEKPVETVVLHPPEETKVDQEAAEASERFENEAFKNEVERFIEISKYFSSPLKKTASYLSEQLLVSYPNTFSVEYKRGNITTEHIKFCNLTLEPVYVKLFKLIPELEQIKYINLSLSRCKRIPPGLSFSLGFMYDDVNEKPSCNAKMIFVASRKTTTPCYQVCEIELLIDVLKIRRALPQRKWNK